MLVVSPYVKPNTISKTQYEFASILRFVEDNFGLGRMGTADFPNNDVRSPSIGNMFDLTMKPRKFKTIPSSLNEQYFRHERITDEATEADGD
jgi:hypothetical protein